MSRFWALILLPGKDPRFLPYEVSKVSQEYLVSWLTNGIERVTVKVGERYFDVFFSSTSKIIDAAPNNYATMLCSETLMSGDYIAGEAIAVKRANSEGESHRLDEEDVRTLMTIFPGAEALGVNHG